MEYQNRVERDVDGDGNFEIITQAFQHVGSHNYWVFNLYNYQKGQLVNVNQKAGYPILVQLLNRQNYQVTSRISPGRMKLYSSKLPLQYDRK